MRRLIITAAAIVTLAGCGSASNGATSPDGSTHWSDQDAQTFMSTCQQSGIGATYDCLCIQDAMQSAGKGPDDNPGDALPAAALASCKD